MIPWPPASVYDAALAATVEQLQSGLFWPVPGGKDAKITVAASL